MLAKPPPINWWESNSASLHQTQGASVRIQPGDGPSRCRVIPCRRGTRDPRCQLSDHARTIRLRNGYGIVLAAVINDDYLRRGNRLQGNRPQTLLKKPGIIPARYDHRNRALTIGKHRDHSATLRAVTSTIDPTHPKIAGLLEDAKNGILAFCGFPEQHWRQIWCECRGHLARFVGER